MNVSARFVLAVALSAACLLTPGSPIQAARQAAPEHPRVLLVSIDGLMPSAYTDPAFAAQTPNLRRLMRDGVWAEGVIGVTPTVTFPSHTTLITGVEPARHGVYDNRILDPENRSNGAWYCSGPSARRAASTTPPGSPAASRTTGRRPIAIAST